jgi:hypothetical protein
VTVKFKTIEGYVPDSKRSALENIAYWEERLDALCAGMMTYASKTEFMQWVDEGYERAFDAYQDFLSMPDV